MNIIDVMNTHLHYKVRGTMRNLHPTTMPLWALIKGVRENKGLAELTAQGRAIGNHDEFVMWKPRNLLSVYLAPRFRDAEGRADEANVCGYTGLAGFDFDGVENPLEVMEKLREVPQVVCASTSVSGKGVWCVARVSASTAAEYLSCYAAGVSAFRERNIPGIDIGIWDVTRARFVSSCPECWWRWDGIDVPAFEPVGDLTVLESEKKKNGKKRQVQMPSGYRQTSLGLAMDQVRQVLMQADDVPDGERNTEKARELGQIKAIAERAGVDPEIYKQSFIDKWDSVGSTRKKTRNMANRLLGKNKEKGAK